MHNGYWTELIPDTVNGEPCWVAAHHQLGAVLGQGRTQAEAIADLAEATEAVLRIMEDCGDPIPCFNAPSVLPGRLMESGGRMYVCCRCREQMGLNQDEFHLAAEWEARHRDCWEERWPDWR